MGHGITGTDEMFSVREPTWHGLGVVLPDYPTRAEAQALAHPWEPVTEPLYRAEPVVGADGSLTTAYTPVSEHVAVVRSDTAELLGTVSSSYQLVGNTALWDIAEALQGAATDVMFETAGSLNGGRKVWVLVRLEEPLVVKGDVNGAHLPFFMLQNAHDGSGAFRGSATMVRVVCQNTVRMADLDAQQRGTEFAFSHTKNVGARVEQAREAVAGWRESIQSWRLLQDELVARTVDEDRIRDFVAAFIPEPPAGLASERVRSNVADSRRQLLDILDGPTIESVRHTAYGLVAAASEYSEHVRRARSRETRFARAWLTRNAVMSDAVDIAMSLV